MSAQPPMQTPYEPPTREQRRSAWRWGCGLALAGCLIVIVVLLVFGFIALLSRTGGMEEFSVGGGQIALIRIDGLIAAGQSGFSILGGGATGSDDVVEQIERAVEDPAVKAILVRINSPGGSAAASQEIYQALMEARNQHKVVVVSMADVASSGAYYVSAAADRIFADPATLTGSIGVISMTEDLSGLFQKIGVKPEIVKAGKLKDMFSPYRPVSDEARSIMQTMVDEVHRQFIEAVAKGRRMKIEEVAKLSDGRVYSGTQAQKLGLVDELGGMQQAVRKAAEMAGLKGKPRLREYGAKSLLQRLLGGSKSQAVALEGRLLYDDFAARMVQGTLHSAVRPGEM